jgi:hypothetical protein
MSLQLTFTLSSDTNTDYNVTLLLQLMDGTRLCSAVKAEREEGKDITRIIKLSNKISE